MELVVGKCNYNFERTITSEERSKGLFFGQTETLSEWHYDFRYNVLSEVNEYRPKGKDMSAFRMLGKRELNALCMEIAHCIDC